MTRLASTMWAPGDPSWRDVRVIDHRHHSVLSFFRAVLGAARAADAVIFNGALGFRDGYRDLVAALLVTRLARRTRVVIAEATWEPGSRALASAFGRSDMAFKDTSRLLIRQLDQPQVTFCVLSQAERALFPEVWQLRHAQVAHTAFCHTLPAGALEPGSSGDYVFSGGTPLRDYDVLLGAVEGLSHRTVIATRQHLRSVPHNVEAGTWPSDEYLGLMRDAGVVAVPLMSPTLRSAGQQTYLNAMALGKQLVVSDSVGVREYVRESAAATIVPPRDPTAMRQAIQRAFETSSTPAVAAELRRARQDVLRDHSPDCYRAQLRKVAENAAAREVDRDSTPPRP